MKKKTKTEIIICAAVLLGIAFVYDLTQGDGYLGNRIAKREVGEGSSQLEFVIKGEGLEKDLSYTIDVGERVVTEQEAQDLFQAARTELEESIFYPGESADCVYSGLRIRKRYVDNKVQASWDFEPWDVLSDEGEVLDEALPENGELLLAEVTFKVQQYQSLYQFQIHIFPRLSSPEAKVLWGIKQGLKDDDTEICLPEEIDGISIVWKEKREKVFLKVLLLEVIAGGAMVILLQRKRKKEEEERTMAMEYDYSAIVNKFAILLGAGMSTRQSWYSVSARYIDDRKKGLRKKTDIYEEMLRTYYELLDGENELNAYQKFGNRVRSSSYNRFVRLLLQSSYKGARGIGTLLQAEANRAFAERVGKARKLGEEASTRLLFPLVIMMAVIFAIVLAPAVIEFIA